MNERKKSIMYVAISENCDGCGFCVQEFECPAIIFNEEKTKAKIDPAICIKCQQCLTACDRGYITTKISDK